MRGLLELRWIEALAVLLLVLKGDEPHWRARIRRVVAVPNEIRQPSTDRADSEDVRSPDLDELADARMRGEPPAQEGERRAEAVDLPGRSVAGEPTHLSRNVVGESCM